MPTSAEKRDKELHDRDRMFRRWLMWHAEQLAELQAGPWYAEISELLAFLNKMDLNGGDALIRLVKSQGWHAANTGVRYMILREIDKAIVRTREEGGLEPFDDSIPWSCSAPTVFEVIKQFLVGDDRSAASSSPDDRGDTRSVDHD